MPSIRVKTGPNKGRVFPIENAPLTLGREDNQTIQILDHGVSRAHAEIFRIGDMCFVRDLESTNGIFVNNARVSEESLKTGDELLIGTTILVFEGAPPDDSDSAVAFVGGAEEKLTVPAVEIKLEPPTGHVPLATVGREVESKHLLLVSRAGRILRREARIEKAFEKIVEAVCDDIGADQGFLFLIDREGGRLTPRAVVARDDGAQKKISRTIVGRVQKSGLPILVPETAGDGRSDTETGTFMEVKSVICVPVPLEERVEGILYFHTGLEGRVLSLESLERVASVALQLSIALGGQAVHERLRQGFMTAIQALVTAMEIVNPRSQGHAQRVADFSVALGARLGLTPDDLNDLRLAALLHDVGLLAVHQSMGGAYDTAALQEHVHAGERILSGIDGFEKILPGVRYHHERADGSGFPYRLKNDEIPIMARIIIVANVLDNACLRAPGLPIKEAVKEVARGGGKVFDEEVVKALLDCQRSGDLRVAPVPKT